MIHKFLNAQSCWVPNHRLGGCEQSELIPRILKKKQQKLAIEELDFSFFPFDSFYKFFSKIGFS